MQEEREIFMTSNFDFLEKEFPVLANFGRLAEQYCYSDSNSCLMKLGMIGETIVNLIFTYDKIPFPSDNTAVARINALLRENLIDRELGDILHALRKIRNKAAHENYSSIDEGKFCWKWHTVCVNGLCRPMETGITGIMISLCHRNSIPPLLRIRQRKQKKKKY